MPRKLENFSIVIFGASGDLTARKLMPAIYQLAKLQTLPERYRIIGIGRTKYDHEQYRTLMHETVTRYAPGLVEDDDHFKAFSQNIFYLPGEYGDLETYKKLQADIEAVENREGFCDNVIYYLAVPPSLAGPIIQNLYKAQISGGSIRCIGWRKIIVEKPYGSDLASAQKLNSIVAECFDEDQIYRIDHYLAKETVQNLLVFRFGNSMFELLWNHLYVDHVQITSAEDFGIRERGSYYEETGLLRDIIQNHGLQIIAYMAMEPPTSLEADAIRDKKIDIFKHIRRVSPEKIAEDVIIGQYDGYRQEKNVSHDSKVETFAAIRFFIDNERWKGVPFYIRAGKNLKEWITEIVVRLKPLPYKLYKHISEHAEVNKIIIQVHPEERISIRFSAKRPGEEVVLDPVLMDFNYKKSFEGEWLTAYHRLLLDALAGDQTLFLRKDGIEECWRIADNIRAGIKKCGLQPLIYPSGSWGPQEADKLLAKDGFKWRLR